MWQVLSTREWAVLFWGLVIAVVVLWRPGGRRSVRNILSTLFSSKRLILAWVSMAAWFALVVYVGFFIGLWNGGLWKDTVWWLVLAGWGTYLAVLDAKSKRDYFSNAAKRVVSASAVSQFVLNLAPFHLLIELLLQPLIAFLVLTQAVVQYGPGDITVSKRVVNGVVSVFGVLVALATIVKIMLNSRDYFTVQTLYEFGFSIWLPMAMLGWLFPAAVVLTYEELITLYRARVFGRPNRVEYLQIAAAYNIGLHDLNDLLKDVRLSEQVARASSVADVRELRRQKRQRVIRETTARMLNEQRLARFTGVPGVNVDGFMLDQREHAQTKKALEHLHRCAAGHYPHGNFYKPDILRIVNNFSRQGLPDEHSITYKVRRDGQAWYAWRRAATGHIFGIGASEAPGSQWFMDGVKPPRQFPGEGRDDWQQWSGTGEWMA